MAARMERTRHTGIYKRGTRYVAVWENQGRQHKQAFRTLAEAQEAKNNRQGGDRRPTTRQFFEDYARDWIKGYQGRTDRGFSPTSRRDYERALEQYAIPFFKGWRLADIRRPDVRRFVRDLEGKKLSPASVVKNLVPLKALFATAVDDEARRPLYARAREPPARRRRGGGRGQGHDARGARACPRRAAGGLAALLRAARAHRPADLRGARA